MDFYFHTLGPDCIFDTADDGPRADDYCPPKYTYNELYCGCELDECFSLCREPLVANPFECGQCITTEELRDLDRCDRPDEIEIECIADGTGDKYTCLEGELGCVNDSPEYCFV